MMRESFELPTYELSSRPWFGPKARAREHLKEYGRTVQSAGVDALRLIARVIGPEFGDVQHVRFIDFRMNGRFRYTIALCWTASSEAIRQRLYEAAPECVAATGWYPLPQGERLQSSEPFRSLPHSKDLPWVTDGTITHVSSAVDADDGTSVRVDFSDGNSLLLDAGFGRTQGRVTTDRLVAVSHHHRDHIGGVEVGAFGDLPVALPAASAAGLHAQSRLDTIVTRSSTTFLRPDKSYRLGSRASLTPFPVPHMPGAVGYLIDDGHRSLLYTGDIALRSARHDITQLLIDRLPTNRNSTLLVDATMAGRSEGVSLAEPAKSAIESLRTSDVYVVAHHDHLLYAYLDMFHAVKSSEVRGSVNFNVTDSIRPLFQILHRAFILREIDALDPFFAGQYGSSMSAWGESRWLYWHNQATAVPNGRAVWFITPDEFADLEVPLNSVVLPVGRVQLDGATPFDTTPWTGHSDQSALLDCIRRFEALGHRVILFHNYGRRLKKFARDGDVAATPLGINRIEV